MSWQAAGPQKHRDRPPLRPYRIPEKTHQKHPRRGRTHRTHSHSDAGKRSTETSLLAPQQQGEERGGDGEGAGDRGDGACRGHRPPPDGHGRLAGRRQDGWAAQHQGESPRSSLYQRERRGCGVGGDRGWCHGSWRDNLGREPEGPAGKRSGGSAGVAGGTPNYWPFQGVRAVVVSSKKLKNKRKLRQKGNGKALAWDASLNLPPSWGWVARGDAAARIVPRSSGAAVPRSGERAARPEASPRPGTGPGKVRAGTRAKSTAPGLGSGGCQGFGSPPALLLFPSGVGLGPLAAPKRVYPLLHPKRVSSPRRQPLGSNVDRATEGEAEGFVFFFFSAPLNQMMRVHPALSCHGQRQMSRWTRLIIPSATC